MLALDHLVISTEDLERGADEVAEKLGVPLEDGVRHPAFGTHNKLLSLGSDTYLEVIAVDPAAAKPRRARWFGLDRFSGDTRLTNWAVRTKELSNLMAMGAAGPGTAVAASWSGLRWTIVVPEDGQLPLDGIAPALLEWRSEAHPCHALPDRQVRLSQLTLSHPEVQQTYLPDDTRVQTTKGPYAISATFDTPGGSVTL
ncbi:MAG: VOC family protein [Pseudomonadota bacterium]